MAEGFWESSSWSRAEQEYFFYHLHQLPNEQKAFYLNKKAEQMLACRRRRSISGVIDLMKESIEGYPNKDELLRAYLLKARALEMCGKIKQADMNYQAAMEWLGLVSKDKLDAISSYLVFILKHRLKHRYAEVRPLCKKIEEDVFRLIVHDFVMMASRAIVDYRLSRKRLYRTANSALKLVQIRKYENDSDKTGLINLKQYDFMISELLKIVR